MSSRPEWPAFSPAPSAARRPRHGGTVATNHPDHNSTKPPRPSLLSLPLLSALCVKSPSSSVPKNKTAQSKPCPDLVPVICSLLSAISPFSPPRRLLLQLTRPIPQHPRRHTPVHHTPVPANRINPQFPIHHRHPNMIPRVRHIHQLHIRILLQLFSDFAQSWKKWPHLLRRVIQPILRHEMHPSRHNRRRHPEMHMRTARPVFIHIHANHSLMKHIQSTHRHSRAQTQRRLREYQHISS